MPLSRIPLEPSNTYHIYNRSVGGQNIFCEEKNYPFFLSQLIPRISLFSDVLAYCLTPNYFHFLIRIKEEKELVTRWQDKMNLLREKRIKKNSDKTADHFLLNHLMITEFSNAFNSYVQAYNKIYRRYGSLLKESFQRKIVAGNEDLLKGICYMHNYPVSHGFTAEKETWKPSSYLDILNQQKSFVLVEEVLQLFNGIENFVHLHNRFPGSGNGFNIVE